MRRLTIAIVVAAMASTAIADDLLGFDAAGSAAQRSLEAEFDTHLSAEDMEDWIRQMSARPHHVGSAAGRDVVELAAGMLESWGYDVEIAEYDILLPTPVTRELELVSPSTYVAGLDEARHYRRGVPTSEANSG